MNCIACQSTDVTRIDLNFDPHCVTSDCQPVRYRPNIYFCQHCSLVQKKIDQDYKILTQQIYQDYKIYDQAGGVEQAVFTQTGDALPRSQVIIDWLTSHVKLGEQGKLLEIGCGNGSFLRSFAQQREWVLTGTEFDDRNRQHIEAIKNSRFFNGDFVEINEQFDLIVCIHVLEHIYDPREFLLNCSQKLTPTGKILIEVPDLDSSPFDIFIADHCAHFSINSLIKLVHRCQLKVVSISNRVVGKEITIVLERDQSTHYVALVATYQALTTGLAEKINALSPDRTICMFGSSIAATVIASKLSTKIQFFVDEDQSKIGNQHLGLPILAMNEVPAGAVVVLPMNPSTALNIANRLAGRDIEFLF